LIRLASKSYTIKPSGINVDYDDPSNLEQYGKAVLAHLDDLIPTLK